MEKEEKVLTYTLNWGDGNLIVTNLNEGLELALGSDLDPEPDEDGYELTIRIERKYTQTEVDNLPEFQM